MLLNKMHRLASWITQSRTKSVSDESASAGTSNSAFEFDPMWHGDHWQNLLSSPMDARRYVMEDWSVATPLEWDEMDGAVPAR